MSEPKSPSHVCVLCNAKLESKESLQEHFRKHANREIDGKGRPRKAKVPGGIVGCGPKKSPVVPHQNLQRVGLQSQGMSSDGSAIASSNSSSSSVCKPQISNNVTTPGGGKSPGKSSTGIVCDVCGQEFETVTIAIQHKFKKHPDSAIKHFCPHCGQQFPLKINRDKHLQVHPSTPPSQLFPCQECGVVFYNAQAQNYHFKSTHKRIVAIFKPVETPPPSKKIRVNNAGEAQSVYYCHICGYEYIIKFNLQKHIERHHPEKERNAIPEGIIKCTTCDALFYSKKAYENHNMYHRPDDLYVTSEEQRLQTVSRVDQDFDIRRVQPGPDKFIPVNRPRPSRASLSVAKMDSKKRLMSKLKNRRSQTQKTRKKAAMPSKEESSDDTEESDTSSESELSPDSGPDSDSDSDVPLKTSVDPSKSVHAPQTGNLEGEMKAFKVVTSESKETSKCQVRMKKKMKLEGSAESKEEPLGQPSVAEEDILLQPLKDSSEGKSCRELENNRQRKKKVNGGKNLVGESEQVKLNNVRGSEFGKIKGDIVEGENKSGLLDSPKGKGKLCVEDERLTNIGNHSSLDVSSDGSVAIETLQHKSSIGVTKVATLKEDTRCDNGVLSNKTFIGVHSPEGTKNKSS